MSELLTLNQRYQLLHPIGTGGMSVVHKALDKMLERTVAIKLLREDYSNDPAFRDRFRQEARAAANLSHPNIVTVYDFGLDQQYLFIVMEFMAGTDLKTLIRQKKIFSVEEALYLMIQACAGIGYAHRAGLIHCDIKPHNMLVSPDQRLKVTDFGIARALSTIPAEEHNEVVWGSPHYFSPEQASGNAPSPASDVYSLGVILYEMLTGKLPFNSADQDELVRMHREDQPVPPRQLNPGIPQQLEDILLKVLSKEPSARYRTADQLGRLLSGLVQTGDLEQLFITSIPAVDPKQILSAGTMPAQTTPPLRTINQGQTSNDLVKTLPPPSQVLPDKIDLMKQNQKSFDWQSWLIGLVAFAMLLGLIPFWLYIYLTLTP